MKIVYKKRWGLTHLFLLDSYIVIKKRIHFPCSQVT